MISLMVGQVLLEASVLCGILILVAKHEADHSFSKVAMVTAGIMLGTFLIEAFTVDRITLAPKWSLLMES